MWFAAVWAMWSNAPLTVSQGREGPGLVEGPSLRRATGKVFRQEKTEVKALWHEYPHNSNFAADKMI